jgi:hypothetical protein
MSEETIPAASVAETQMGSADVAAHGQRASVRELIESLLVTVLLALFGTTFVVRRSRSRPNPWSRRCWLATISW